MMEVVMKTAKEEMEAVIATALDDLNEGLLEEALTDYLIESRRVSNFTEWLEKWKEKKRKITSKG
jgi:response regulator of citrate/malate metabolism